MFQRQGGAAYKADLSRTEALCQYLGHPEKGLRCVHVAGTNGKGSVSHMWAATLQVHGYKTGLFTSPHLKDFRERIRINGVPVSEAFVVEWVQRHRDYLEQAGLSFFEMNVGMALDAFRQERVDVAVMEVGMGGRLDSTNVVHPDLCVITNISFDHMQYLGDTLEKIAREKAGIIKANIPVVVGETLPETKKVFASVAQEQSAPLYFAEDLPDFTAPECDLKGSYQQKNLRTFLQSVAVAREGFGLQDQRVDEALQQVKALTGLRGRWEILSNDPLVITDTGHNEAGVRLVLEQLASLGRKQWHLVWGMVNDKDVSGILALMPKDAKYYFCKPDVPRGLDAEQLRDLAAPFGLKGAVFSSVQEALAQAQIAVAEGEGIFVGGSTFVVAEVI